MAKRGRPLGTGKPPDEKYVQRAFKLHPKLWEQFAALVPARERSACIRGYIEREVRKRPRA